MSKHVQIVRKEEFQRCVRNHVGFRMLCFTSLSDFLKVNRCAITLHRMCLAVEKQG